jgi:pilus assembly protein CpaD
MIRHGYPLAIALALAACAPGAAEYTKAEAPNKLQVQGATSTVEVAFFPGSSRLAGPAARRLDRLVADGATRPAGRVMVAAAGPPGLAAARAAAISRQLLRWGIVAKAQPLPSVPPNRAVVTVGRYAVTLPPCPNWSQPRANDFTNAPTSNFGCATSVNLGLMVARPADLVAGGPLEPAAGEPAASAVNRYLNDKVPPLPSEANLSPIQGGTGGGPTGSSTETGNQ